MDGLPRMLNDGTPIIVPKSKPYSEAENRRNAIAAAERDGGLCQWCLRVDGIHRNGSTPHHIHRKRVDWSTRGQITLCIQHHDAFHRATQVNGETLVTVAKLERLIEVIYGEG